MPTLPDAIIDLLEPIAALFGRRTWTKVKVLLMGAILAPGKRTVTAALRVMGLTKETTFDSLVKRPLCDEPWRGDVVGTEVVKEAAAGP